MERTWYQIRDQRLKYPCGQTYTSYAGGKYVVNCLAKSDFKSVVDSIRYIPTHYIRKTAVMCVWFTQYARKLG